VERSFAETGCQTCGIRAETKRPQLVELGTMTEIA
jgi:hypothetical protein